MTPDPIHKSKRMYALGILAIVSVLRIAGIDLSSDVVELIEKITELTAEIVAAGLILRSKLKEL